MALDKTSPESKIFLNGQEIPPELRVDVLEVCVRQYVEGADCFDITVNVLDSANQQFKWIDSEDFNPGNTVEVQMGYLNEHETVIVGEITALHAHYANDEATLLNIQGFDKLHRFRRGRNTQSFLEMKDSQIAEKIAQKMGLTPQVEDSEIVHEYVLQNNLSDIDFLLDRARRIRFEVNVSDKTLIFRKAANYLGKSVTLEYMRDLKSFSPRLSTAQQVSEVKVRGWNPKSKEPILGVAKAGDETTDMEGSNIGPKIAEQAFNKTMAEIVDIPIVSQSEAEQIAKAKFNDLAIELIGGEGEAVGDPRIRAGNTIEILGLGKRFSGVYYIRSCEHRMTPQIGYITKFNAERNAS